MYKSEKIPDFSKEKSPVSKYGGPIYVLIFDTINRRWELCRYTRERNCKKTLNIEDVMGLSEILTGTDKEAVDVKAIGEKITLYEGRTPWES